MKLAPVICLVTVCLGSLACVATGQDNAKPPGSIKMLDGYSHEKSRGVDTETGKISRKGGVTIEYDIGEEAGEYADRGKQQYQWFREQKVNDHQVRIGYTKDKELVVTFLDGPANFFAKIKKDEDLVDALLMVLTYTPPKAKAKK